MNGIRFHEEPIFTRSVCLTEKRKYLMSIMLKSVWTTARCPTVVQNKSSNKVQFEYKTAFVQHKRKTNERNKS